MQKTVCILQPLSPPGHTTLDRKLRTFEQIDKQNKHFSGILYSVLWPENNPRHNHRKINNSFFRIKGLVSACYVPQSMFDKTDN